MIHFVSTSCIREVRSEKSHTFFRLFWRCISTREDVCKWRWHKTCFHAVSQRRIRLSLSPPFSALAKQLKAPHSDMAVRPRFRNGSDPFSASSSTPKRLRRCLPDPPWRVSARLVSPAMSCQSSLQMPITAFKHLLVSPLVISNDSLVSHSSSVCFFILLSLTRPCQSSQPSCSHFSYSSSFHQKNLTKDDIYPNWFDWEFWLNPLNDVRLSPRQCLEQCLAFWECHERTRMLISVSRFFSSEHLRDSSMVSMLLLTRSFSL